MHIPDGYLSPQTTIPAIVAMLPLLFINGTVPNKKW